MIGEDAIRWPARHAGQDVVGCPETAVVAQFGQPILSLVSRVFLNEHERIIGPLRRTGLELLLCYLRQQVAQFRRVLRPLKEIAHAKRQGAKVL